MDTTDRLTHTLTEIMDWARLTAVPTEDWARLLEIVTVAISRENIQSYSDGFREGIAQGTENAFLRGVHLVEIRHPDDESKSPTLTEKEWEKYREGCTCEGCDPNLTPRRIVGRRAEAYRQFVQLNTRQAGDDNGNR